MINQRQPTMVCVSSGKGGVGKTTVTVNLASAWANAGHKVLIIDGDLGLANVDLLMGLHAQSTICNALDADASVDTCLIHVNERLSVLPAASGVPEMVALGPDDRNRLKEVITTVAADYSLVVIDTAAGIGDSVIWFNQMACANVLVVTPDPTAVTDVYALMKVLSQRYGRNRVRVVVNQAASPSEGREVFGHLQTVAEKFLQVQMSHLGSLTQDPIVARAVREQTPFVDQWPTSPPANAMVAIADGLFSEIMNSPE